MKASKAFSSGYFLLPMKTTGKKQSTINPNTVRRYFHKFLVLYSQRNLFYLHKINSHQNETKNWFGFLQTMAVKLEIIWVLLWMNFFWTFYATNSCMVRFRQKQLCTYVCTPFHINTFKPKYCFLLTQTYYAPRNVLVQELRRGQKNFPLQYTELQQPWRIWTEWHCCIQ